MNIPDDLTRCTGIELWSLWLLRKHQDAPADLGARVRVELTTRFHASGSRSDVFFALFTDVSVMSDREMKALATKYTPEPGWVLGSRSGRHDNAASKELGEVYRHRLGKDGDYPEIGVVEAQKAHSALAFAYAERDAYVEARTDVPMLVEEVLRLRKAMRRALSDLPSDQSRGYETLSMALGEP